jgi:cytidine deaminase
MNEDVGPGVDESTALGLLDAAREARGRSYSPYSRFPVGAALLDSDGRVHQGANVENAAYGLSMCAERTALHHAVASGVRTFLAIAVVGPEESESCAPCGSCRQALHEFAPALPVVTIDAAGVVITPISELLPRAFGPADLSERGER